MLIRDTRGKVLSAQCSLTEEERAQPASVPCFIVFGSQAHLSNDELTEGIPAVEPTAFQRVTLFNKRFLEKSTSHV